MRLLGFSLLLLLGLPHARVAAHEEVGSAEIPALIASLSAGDPEVRTRARDTLLDALLVDLPREAVFSESARPATADVRAALRSDDVTIRILAASAASRMGLHARPLLDDLFAGFGAGVFAFDYQVVEAVRKLGLEAVSVAPKLAAATHAYAEWSWEASSKDGRFTSGRDVASANRAALAALRAAGLDALRGSMAKRPYVRPAVRTQLGSFEKHFGPAKGEAPREPAPAPDPVAPPTAWLARIEADVAARGAPQAPNARRDPRDRSWPSLEELYALGERAVPALTFALSHGTGAVRTTCLDVLAGLGTQAQSAGDAIFALVSSSDADLQTRAATALGTSGATDIAWLDTLLPLLDATSNESVRLGVTQTLGRMGPAASKARPVLLQALATMSPPTPTLDGIPVDARLRDATIVALGQIGGPPDVLVPALLDEGASGAVWRPWSMPHGGYRGPSWERPTRGSVRLRVSAAKAIGGLGVAALPAVRAGLRSDDPAVRTTAAVALAHLPPDAIGESAIVASRDEDPDVRRAALAALQVSADTSAVRALMARIADTDSGVATAAIGALGKLGARAEAAAADLAELVVTGSAQARAALEALEAIRPDVETLHAPTLVSAMVAGTLRAKDGIWRLRQLGPVARAQAPRLVAALADMSEPDQRVTLAYLTAEAADDLTLVVDRRVHEPKSIAVLG